MSLRNPERGWFTVKGLIFSLGLAASFIVVAVVYAAIIRPQAETASLASAYGVEAGGSIASLAVVLKDFEQQVCLSLFLWGLMLVGYKFAQVRVEAGALDRLAPEPDSGRAAPVDWPAELESIDRARAGKLAGQIAAAERDDPGLANRVLPYVMARGLERFHVTGSVPEATETVMGRLNVAAEQQESELSMLRYLVWAIPSIGFIGTVRGIGLALQRADDALSGDISGVTGALGTAFNSTLVALFISLILMLVIHILQGGQEGFILRLQRFCREQVLDRLFERRDDEETERADKQPGEAPSGPPPAAEATD